MTIVINDLIEEAAINEDKDGITATRSFFIDGLSGNGVTKMAQALFLPGIPVYREAHPVLARLIVVNKKVVPIGQSAQFKVVVDYAPPRGGDSEQPILNVGGSLQSSKTNLGYLIGTQQGGAAPEPMFIQPDGQVGERRLYTLPRQPVLADIQLPMITVGVTRKEVAVNPLTIAKKYLGKINKESFLGFEPHKVLCTRTNANTQDDAESYTMDYEFSIKNDALGWNIHAVYKDPLTDAPILGADPANNATEATFILYNEVDLRELNIDIEPAQDTGLGISSLVSFGVGTGTFGVQT